MAIENITAVTSSSLVSGLLDKLAIIPGMGTLVNILQAVGVVIVIYFIFLIVKAIIDIRHNLNIRKIALNVEEINKKMDKLIDVRKGKK